MKTIKYIALLALVMTLGIGVSSCGGYSNGKAREMIKKADKDKLKKDDYAQMIDWYEEANDKYVEGWEKVIKDNKDYMDYTLENQEFGISILHKYPYIGNITDILESADEEEMGASNYKKFHKLKDKFEERMEKLGDKVPEKKSEKASELGDIDLSEAQMEVLPEQYDDYADYEEEVVYE